MAGEISFDVVSDFDEQELRNALDQVRREVQQRYDFKGGHVDLVQEKTRLVLVTDSDMRARAIRDLIESKAVRRNDLARKLVKLIRDEFPKVQPRVQGDAIRVAGKSKDELQKVIVRLRELDEDVPLQFENYR